MGNNIVQDNYTIGFLLILLELQKSTAHVV